MRMFASFLKCNSGAAALIYAIAVVPLLMAVGIAVDFGRSIHLRSELQAAADAASLAGASLERPGEGKRRQAAIDYLTENTRKLDVPADWKVDVSNGEVSVRLVSRLPFRFLNMENVPTSPVAAASTAVFGRSSGPCILTLHSNMKEALMLNSDSRIEAPDCQVQTNSTNAEALRGNSNGDINSARTCVTGGWVRDTSSQFNPEPEQCNPVPDPLAHLPVPPEADDPCDYTDLTVEGTRTLYPGVYCKKLELNSGAKVTFAEGIYVIRDGEFIVNSHSSASGSNVMFYLTGTQNNPRFNINSDSHVEFRGRKSGPYAGIVFFQARNAVADFSILNSDSSSIIEGVIYLPNSPLHLNSYGNVSDASPWTAIISLALEVNSHSTLHINSDYASSDVPVPPGIGGDPRQRSVWLKK